MTINSYMLTSSAKDLLVTLASLEKFSFMKRWSIAVSIYLPQNHCQNQYWILGTPREWWRVIFVFVAGNAFPLSTGIMKPYPDKGLTDEKKIWKPFITLSSLPGFADQIDGDNVVECSWRKEINACVFQPLPSQKHGNNSKRIAKSIWEYFADYFHGPAAVPWQWKTLI